jgi:hypothetical protein
MQPCLPSGKGARRVFAESTGRALIGDRIHCLISKKTKARSLSGSGLSPTCLNRSDPRATLHLEPEKIRAHEPEAGHT